MENTTEPTEPIEREAARGGGITTPVRSERRSRSASRSHLCSANLRFGTAFGLSLAAASLLATYLPAHATASDKRWMETYIQAQGGCGAPGFSLSVLFSGSARQNPFGKPAGLWTDEDLAELPRAMAECQHQADLTGNRYISSGIRAEIARIVPEIESVVRRARVEREREEAQAKAQKVLAETQAENARQRARQAREAAEERARKAEAERAAAEELARDEKARAEAALREVQAKAATERARREAAEAHATLEAARKQSTSQNTQLLASPGQPFCTEYEELEEFVLALANGDRQRVSGMAGCLGLAEGTKISVIKDYPSGTPIGHVVKVRAVSANGASAVGYTLSIGLKYASGKEY